MKPETPPVPAVSTGAGAVGPAPQIVRGTCFALFAYDFGLAVDLDHAQRLITESRERGPLRHQRRTPYYFDYQPAPLRVTLAVPPIQVGAHCTEPTVEALLYDFGALSVQYALPLAGSLEDLLALSGALYNNRALLEGSRRIVESQLAPIRPAVNQPCIPELVEDFAIYQIEQLAPAPEVDVLLTRYDRLLAQILRAEQSALAPQEVADALSCQIAFSNHDRTLIDWNAALLFGRDLDDVRAVLEFANVELLELRYLDDRLDAALNEAYAVAGRRHWIFGGLTSRKTTDLWRIARLQMDSALLYEGVHNALKLLGDQFLARVHRLAAQRFHLDDWDASIRRKLQTIESIYLKLSDLRAHLRAEVLEWIIILLIALEILLAVTRHA